MESPFLFPSGPLTISESFHMCQSRVKKADTNDTKNRQERETKRGSDMPGPIFLIERIVIGE